MRVTVIGASGAGKSTFARTLAQRLGCRHIELDAIYHQRGWTPLPEDEFRARVGAAIADDAWVCDGNYGAVRSIVEARATDVVWLDLSLPLVMTRIVRRTVWRAITRQELWNGNRERVADWLTAEHPLRWTLATFASRRKEIGQRMATLEHVRTHRVRTPLEVTHLLDRLITE